MGSSAGRFLTLRAICLLVPFAAACSYKSECTRSDVECNLPLMLIAFSRLQYSRALYVANNGGTAVSMFTINRNTGLLTPQGTVPTSAGTPLNMGMHPSGVYAYATHSGGLQAYRVEDSALLTSVGTQATGTSPQIPIPHPNGSYVYTVNQLGTNVTMMTVGPGGVLSSLGNQSAGGNPQSGVIDPRGRFLFVINNLSADISRFTFLPGGALVLDGTVSGPIAPVKSAMDAFGRFLIITELNAISLWSIDAAGGLTLAGLTSMTPAPDSFAVDSLGRFLFVCNITTGAVYSYIINANGTLTQSGTTALAGAQMPGIEPYGRFLYVPTASQVNVYSINQVTGVLTLAGSAAGPATPGGAVVGFGFY